VLKLCAILIGLLQGGWYAIAQAADVSANASVNAAANYPQRPIRLLVLFPPGGSDTVARIFGQRAADRLGQPFVIDNRPGAAGVIGADIAAKSPPDGYTLLFATASFAMTSAWERKLPYDAIRDFSTIGLLAYTPFMLTVHPTLPVNTVKEFIAYAKSKPDQINVSTTGTGGIGHLGTASLATLAGLRFNYVPYKGTGPALTAALAGEVHFTMVTVGTSLPYARNGRLRALGVSSARRSALAPDIPSLAEAGVTGMDVVTWYGLSAPRNLPTAIVNRLHREMVEISKANDYREQIAALGIEPQVTSPQDFGRYMQSEITRWSQAIKDAGLTLN
jgi:tripartite-type tricarboxylate transporter receptor subunit TctC